MEDSVNSFPPYTPSKVRSVLDIPKEELEKIDRAAKNRFQFIADEHYVKFYNLHNATKDLKITLEECFETLCDHNFDFLSALSNLNSIPRTRSDLIELIRLVIKEG